MNLLIWRGWEPRKPPAIYSFLETHATSGTDSNLLWHARNLRLLGHRVSVLGVSDDDVVQEDIAFVGARTRAEQEKRLAALDLKPEVIFLEGAFEAAPLFRRLFPVATIVQIGQNMDRSHRGPNNPLHDKDLIDLFALVGEGQFAAHCVRYPTLRGRFVLIPNVVPWESVFSRMPVERVDDDLVLWVGSWGKKGLREWSVTMERILRERPNTRWQLLGPRYGDEEMPLPHHLFDGLQIPRDRVSVACLPIKEAFLAMSRARVILVSLGLECLPVAALDGHAAGRPLLSGNDMVYKYANPEGTGVRVTTPSERYHALRLLLSDAEVCNQMGRAGRALIVAKYTEAFQRECLATLLEFIRLKARLGGLASSEAPGPIAERLSDIRETARRRWVTRIKARIAKSVVPRGGC